MSIDCSRFRSPADARISRTGGGLRRRLIIPSAVAPIAFLAAAPVAHAELRTLNSGATEWLQPYSWNPIGVPTADDWVFIYSNNGDMSITAGDMTVQSITYANMINRVLGNATSGSTDSTLTLDGNSDGFLLSDADGTSIPVTFTIQGTNSGTGTGRLNLVLNGSGDVFVQNNGSVLDISSNISEIGGPRSINVVGGGTLQLEGANTYTGQTTVSSGTLLLSGAGSIAASSAIGITTGTLQIDNSAINNDRLGDAAPISLDNGVMQFDGNADAPSSENAGVLQIAGGQNSVVMSPAAGIGSLETLAFSGISTSGNGAVDFTIGNGATAKIASPSLINGIIGGWATINGSDWATVDGTGNVVPFAAFNNSADSSTWQIADNVNAAGPVNINADTAINSLRFSSPNQTDAITIAAGHSLNVANGILFAGAQGQSISGPGSLTAGTSAGSQLIVQVPTGTFTITAPIVDNAGGSVRLLKAADGTLMLNAGNTFTGDAIVAGGTLGLGPQGSLAANTVDLSVNASLDVSNMTTSIGGLSGQGTVIADNSILSVGGNNQSTTYSGAMNGPGGSLVKIGSGTLTLDGTVQSAYSGSTTLDAGTLVVASDQRLGAVPSSADPGNLVINAGTLRLLDGARLNINRGMLIGPGNPIINVPAGATGAMAGTIGDAPAGGSGLHLTGGGTLDLQTGVDTYTGGVIIDGSTLQTVRDTALGAVPETFTPDAVILNGGTLRIYSNYTVGYDLAPTRGIYVTANGGTLSLDQSSSVPQLNTVISGPGKLTKDGNRTVLVNVPQTFEGGLDIVRGRWNMQVNGAAGPGTISLKSNDGVIAQLGIGGTNVGAAITVPNDIVLDPVGTGINSFEVNDSTPTQNNLILNGDISGPGDLIKGRVAGTSGILTLGGNNTYAGTTSVLLGTLRLSGGSAIPDASTVVLANTAGVLLDLNGSSETIGGLSGGGSAGGNVALGAGTLTIAQSADSTFGGVISGAGGIIKSGAGALTLASAQTYAGPTTVADGKLILDQSLTTSSAISVTGGALVLPSDGTQDKLIIAPSVSTSGDGVIDLADNKMIVTSPGAIGDYDTAAQKYTGILGQVASARNGNQWTGRPGITSSLASTGGSTLMTLGVAKVGDVRQIADSATTIIAGQTVHGSDCLVMYTYGGDANLDGRINIDDYGIIDANVAQSGSVFGWDKGDFNYDGKINIDDYGIIDTNIGLQAAPLPTIEAPADAGVSAVPEPGPLGLLAVIGAGLLRRRIHVPGSGTPIER